MPRRSPSSPPDDTLQRPPAAIPRRVWDVVVAGAGPAGCACAAALAGAGAAVLLLDADAFPREKVCGDGLLPDALAAVDRMGAGDEVRSLSHPVEGLSLFSPSGREVPIEGSFRTLQRERLDACLARCAVRRGSCFARGRVESLRPETDGILTAAVAGAPDEIRARWAVVATGARGALPQRVAASPERRPARAVALRGYVQSSSGPGRAIVSYDRSVLPGYAWIFPLGGGLYNVGCGAFSGERARRGQPLGNVLQAFGEIFPPARALLAEGQWEGPPRGGVLRCGLRGAPPLLGPRILAVGEAAGTTLPFTGEGIGKAMETGELAAQAVLQALESDSPKAVRDYPQAVRSLASRYRPYEVAERWIATPWLADLVAVRAARSSALRSAASRFLWELADPREIFSVWGMLRSFVR